VARDLNVDFVVAGTIQKVGSKIRVLVQAHGVRNAATLHSTKLDGAWTTCSVCKIALQIWFAKRSFLTKDNPM
jgi:TolB-like protein